jgi:hypothetical protein
VPAFLGPFESAKAVPIGTTASENAKSAATIALVVLLLIKERLNRLVREGAPDCMKIDIISTGYAYK